MDGLVYVTLFALPGQALLVGLADVGILIASLLLAAFSALALARQIFVAISATE